jgi:type IV secretory pathway VirB10-like protein
MRKVSALLLITIVNLVTIAAPAQNQSASSSAAAGANASLATIAAGTKVPLALKQAISTKTAKEGDAVYCETVFPVVQDGRMLIPAGTYVQGKISHIQRAGRVKGRAEVLMHFTTLIYPNGYTVMLPGSVENVPGAEKTSMKGPEGAVRQDSQTGEKVGSIASTGATGAAIGAISAGGKGALIGAGIGGAAGTAIALLTRGNDVRLQNGTSIEMVIQREVTLDSSRIPTVLTQQKIVPQHFKP